MVGHFLAVERHVLGPDLLYRVVVEAGAVCGLRVGGQWSWVVIKLVLLGELALFAREPVRVDPKLEAAYEGLPPCGRDAIAADRRNFRLRAEHVERVGLRAGRGDRAEVRFHLRNGKRPRVLRVAAAELDTVAALLGRHAFRVERG